MQAPRRQVAHLGNAKGKQQNDRKGGDTVTTDEQRLADEVAAELGSILTEDYESIFGRAPRWSYFHDRYKWFCWTTEPALDERERQRFVSWVVIFKGDTGYPRQRVLHVKRKDAKARALRLCQAAKAEGVEA